MLGFGSSVNWDKFKPKCYCPAMEPCPFLRLTIDQPCTQNSRGFQNAHCCSSFFFSMLMQTQAQELYLNVKVEPNLDFQEYNCFMLC